VIPDHADKKAMARTPERTEKREHEFAFDQIAERETRRVP